MDALRKEQIKVILEHFRMVDYARTPSAYDNPPMNPFEDSYLALQLPNFLPKDKFQWALFLKKEKYVFVLEDVSERIHVKGGDGYIKFKQWTEESDYLHLAITYCILRYVEDFNIRQMEKK